MNYLEQKYNIKLHLSHKKYILNKEYSLFIKDKLYVFINNKFSKNCLLFKYKGFDNNLKTQIIYLNNYSLDSTYNLGDIFISKFTNKPTPYSCKPLTHTFAQSNLNIKDILKNGYTYSTIYEVPNIPLQDKRLEKVTIYIYCLLYTSPSPRD